MSNQPEPNPPPQQKELSGKIGKYQLVRMLGKGAMGMVYIAHDTLLERDVALKVMVAQIASDPELKNRFEREAKAVAKMTHPNVVTVFDLGYHEDGSPFIAMELLKGEDLHKAMRKPLTVDRKLSITVQVLAGLAHAHKAGIVHRDIKPANIFLNEDGSAKIMDFGVARLAASNMTGTGNIVGTADYMSPEQVKGAHVDGRSDVFSVGCVLYEVLAGSRPFHSDNLMTIFYKITHEEPDYSKIPADSQGLVPILKKSLNKDLEGRYQSAYEFAMDLRNYVATTASSLSGQRALDNVGEIEPPSSGGTALTAGTSPVGSDETIVTDGGTTGHTPTAAGTAQGRATLKAPPTVVPTQLVREAPTSAQRRPASRPPERPTVMAPRPAPPPPNRTPLYVGGALVLAVLVGGAVYFLKPGAQVPQATPAPPVATPAPVQATPPPAQPSPSPVAAQPTPAPPVSPAGPRKVAANLVPAEVALQQGDYARAEAEAQKVFREDPSNERANQILLNARAGAKAEEHIQKAEAALAKGDEQTALNEAHTARDIYRQDPKITDLLDRISSHKVQPPPNKEIPVVPAPGPNAQIPALLNQAIDAIGKKEYDQADNIYQQILKMDPANQAALSGRTSLAAVRAMAATTPGTTSAGCHTFQASGTTSAAPEGDGTGAPPGFDSTSGVKSKLATESAALPGKIAFEYPSGCLNAGDNFKVKISLRNEGSAPIDVKFIFVNTKINGKGVNGRVPPMVSSVAPGQRAALWQIEDSWKQDTQNWSCEVTITTARNETYKSQLAWK
jgi:tRNA A-37 threonylcarbamoyl transferase component Bud32/tetratricopeptide (TPR) repeat protein